MTQFRSPIIWRLVLWFLLLSLIPIGIVLVFIQRQMRNTVVDMQLQDLRNSAVLFSAQVAHQPKRAQEITSEQGLTGSTVFLLDQQGVYVAHSDPGKIGTSASQDLGPDIVEQILFLQETSIDLSSSGKYLGKSKVENSNLVAVVMEDSSIIRGRLDNLSNSIILQLAVSLLITSLAGGTVILTVLSPLTELAKYADQLGRGKLETVYDTSDLEGELVTLAKSLNDLAIRVQNSISDLEDRVALRTKELATRSEELEKANIRMQHRSIQFEAITRVSQVINTTRNLQNLLPRITEVIHDQFGFYHVGIFLNDVMNLYTFLSAANSEGGKRMLERHHHLKVGEQGIVGYVTGSGKGRVALDVGEDAVFFNNPELPNTRSEMALPLLSEGNIIGALDVQSTEPNAFLDEDVEVLSTLADQVSLAIQNARLFDQTQKLLAEAEVIHRQYLRESWNLLSQNQNFRGYRYTVRGVELLEEGYFENKRSDSHPTDKDREDRQQGITVPINLRGETIGSLIVQIPKEERIKSDQMDLIKAVAERVALSIENARLFEETSRRAERERLVSEITTRIRGSNDPQEMIKTAMEELRRALGATKVEIVPQKTTLQSDQ